jgi:Bacterial pre-peptidase C-terminal domain
MSKRRGALLVFLLSVALGVPGLLAEDKKPEKKDEPRVVVAVPLGVAPGATTKVTLRGVKLDTATAVRCTSDGVTVKLLNKGKAAVPNQQEPAKVGDTQAEVEVTLPPGFSGNTVSLIVTIPAGETEPHNLLVESTLPVIAEKEPNNGFRQAQPIQVPQVVDGQIAQAQDVDVFRFEGKAGQRVVCEVLAARHGSALDSLLTLYDADGRQVASNDDAAGSSDSLLEVALPRDGVYFLCLQDAHDQGGPAHVYRLVVRPR